MASKLNQLGAWATILGQKELSEAKKDEIRALLVTSLKENKDLLLEELSEEVRVKVFNDPENVPNTTFTAHLTKLGKRKLS